MQNEIISEMLFSTVLTSCRARIARDNRPAWFSDYYKLQLARKCSQNWHFRFINLVRCSQINYQCMQADKEIFAQCNPNNLMQMSTSMTAKAKHDIVVNHHQQAYHHLKVSVQAEPLRNKYLLMVTYPTNLIHACRIAKAKCAVNHNLLTYHHTCTYPLLLHIIMQLLTIQYK